MGQLGTSEAAPKGLEAIDLRVGQRYRLGLQPVAPRIQVRERFVTESGSVYTVDHDEKTLIRVPGPEAGEVAYDNEPFRYTSLTFSPDKCIFAVWWDADGNPKLRQTTKVVHREWVD